MRSVEHQATGRSACRHAALLFACIALGGCAWLSGPKSGARVNDRATAVASAAPASAPVPVGANATGPEVVVTPAQQRAFDEARRLMRAGRMDDAERALLALTQSAPDLGGPHANLGVVYRDSGNRLEPAITELETAVKLSPRQPLFHNELGVTYR
ncbi:hypothetical protein DBR42_11830, partial [Pelomonas sp. HMWF004]